jgi:hypothetical protein
MALLYSLALSCSFLFARHRPSCADVQDVQSVQPGESLVLPPSGNRVTEADYMFLSPEGFDAPSRLGSQERLLPES